MAGTRALFASIGASVALVMAGALALLGASAMFAFGGWTEDLPQSVEKPPLVFAGSDLAQAGGAQTTATSDGGTRIVAPAPERATPRRVEPAPVVRTLPPGETAVARVASGRAGLPPVPEPKHTTPTATASQPTATKSGDRVRKVGDSLSSTVQNTGNALAEATAPLAPPVSQAVQQVLNVVAEIVRRTTDGLSTTLDTLLPPKR